MTNLTAIDHNGMRLMLIQEPYINDDINAPDTMRCHAQDSSGKGYRVTWPLRDGWRESQDDLSFWVDWDSPTVVAE